MSRKMEVTTKVGELVGAEYDGPQLAFEIESMTRRIYSADGTLKSLEVIHFDDDCKALPAIAIPVSGDVRDDG